MFCNFCFWNFIEPLWWPGQLKQVMNWNMSLVITIKKKSWSQYSQRVRKIFSLPRRITFLVLLLHWFTQADLLTRLSDVLPQSALSRVFGLFNNITNIQCVKECSLIHMDLFHITSSVAPRKNFRTSFFLIPTSLRDHWIDT